TKRLTVEHGKALLPVLTGTDLGVRLLHHPRRGAVDRELDELVVRERLDDRVERGLLLLVAVERLHPQAPRVLAVLDRLVVLERVRLLHPDEERLPTVVAVGHLDQFTLLEELGDPTQLRYCHACSLPSSIPPLEAGNRQGPPAPKREGPCLPASGGQEPPAS